MDKNIIKSNYDYTINKAENNKVYVDFTKEKI